MTYLLTLLISLGSALQIPDGLSVAEQERVLEVIGLSTTSKFLSNAYPLGGYSGLEVSLTLDSMPTSDLSNLGTTTNQKADFQYPTLTLGKGIYNNSDLFFHFVPPSKTLELTKFGMSYRWGFYQALFLPINFSLVLNADTGTIKQKLSTRNFSGDLLMGMTLSQISFFLGGGYVVSNGDFAGGANGLTASGKTETQSVESAHFVFGSNYNFEPFFVGMAVNRYFNTVYSLKFGFLF